MISILRIIIFLGGLVFLVLRRDSTKNLRGARYIVIGLSILVLHSLFEIFFHRTMSTAIARQSWFNTLATVSNSIGEPVGFSLLMIGFFMNMYFIRPQHDKHYTSLIENPLVGVCIIQDGVFKLVNSRFAEIFGHHRKELLGKTFLDFVTPEARSLVAEIVATRLQGTVQSTQYQFTGVRKDGSRVDVEVFGSRTIYRGKPAIYDAIVDITEKKKVDATIRNIAEGVAAATGETFFQALVKYLHHTLEVDFAIIGECSENDTSKIQTIAVCESGKIVDNFTYTLAGTPGFDALGPQTRAYATEVGKQFPNDPYLRESGIESHISTPLFDTYNHPIGLLIVMSRQPIQNLELAKSILEIFASRAAAEIERKRAEQMLRKSEADARDLFDNAPDIYCIVDTDLNIASINQRGAEILGWTIDEIVGKQLSVIVPPDDHQRIQQLFASILSTGKVETGLEMRKIRKDGTIFWVSDEFTLVRDENGKVTSIRMVCRDLTEHKKMEEALVKASKLESISILAGRISHDFNNLLTAILGNISLLKTEISEDRSSYKILDEVERVSLRAKTLTQQLLTFSKGWAPLKKKIAVINLLEDAMEFALHGSNVQYKLIVSDAVWPVEVDEGQIRQVIYNFVLNAVEAMPNGGTINLIIENYEGQLPQKLPKTASRYVRIRIADQGVGIPEHDLPKIFDPFFTTKQKGSGLGLTTSYFIVKRHFGHIAVSSRLNVGTTFSIYLPAASENSLPKQKQAIITKGDTGKALIMDDESVVRTIAGRMLEKMGLTVAYAEDGREAIAMYRKALLENERFTLVIMDLTIPGGMGGKEAVHQILALDPKARVIVSSGYSHDPIMADFKNYGFYDVVAKPYVFSELYEVIHRTLVSQDQLPAE